MCFFFYARILSIPTSANAQYEHPSVPFEEIEFIDLKPLWTYVAYDSTIVGDSCDGFNFFSNLPLNGYNNISDGKYLYRVLYRKGKSQPNGTYIEKVEIETGSRIWVDYYGVGKTSNAEFARLLFIDNDNNLVVISQIYPEDPVESDFRLGFGYKGMLLTKRVYHSETGELLEYFRPDFTDVNLLNTDYSAYLQIAHFYQLGKNPDSLLYLYYEAGDNQFKPLLKGRKIKIQSYEYESQAVSLDYKYDKVFSFPKPLRISDSLYLTLEVIESENKLVLRFFNQDFVFIKESVSKSLDLENVTFLNLEDVDVTSGKVLISYEPKNLSGIDNPTNQFLIFDWDANLVNKIQLPFASYNKYPVMSWKDGKFIIGNNQVISAQGAILDSFELLCEDNETLIPYRSFKIKDPKRYLSYFTVLWEDNEKVLINARQSALIESGIFLQQDIHASGQILMMLNKMDLGLISNVAENNSVRKQLVLSPNPAQEFLRIQFDCKHTGIIQIWNTDGRIMREYFLDEDSAFISIMELPAGMYYITFKDKYGLYVKQSVKFIKI